MPELFGFAKRDFAIRLPVGLGHIRKARTEALIVRANQWINALQVDVITDNDQRALGVLQIDAAGGVGKNRRTNSHAAQDTHRESDFLRGVALIEMDAALHRGHSHVPDFSDHQPPGVTNSGRTREARNFFVGDARCFAEFIGEGA